MSLKKINAENEWDKFWSPSSLVTNRENKH